MPLVRVLPQCQVASVVVGMDTKATQVQLTGPAVVRWWRHPLVQDPIHHPLLHKQSSLPPLIYPQWLLEWAIEVMQQCQHVPTW